MLSKKLKLSIGTFPKKSTPCFGGKFIFIKKTPNSLGHPRLGVMVSKKVSAKAAVRNWAKRVIYDCLAEELGGIDNGMDLMIVVSAPIIEISSETKNALISELKEGLKIC